MTQNLHTTDRYGSLKSWEMILWYSRHNFLLAFQHNYTPIVYCFKDISWKSQFFSYFMHNFGAPHSIFIYIYSIQSHYLIRGSDTSSACADRCTDHKWCRCQDDPNGSPTRELEETTSASLYHVAEHRPVRSDSLLPHTEWSSRPGSEPPSVHGGWCLCMVLRTPSGACQKSSSR